MASVIAKETDAWAIINTGWVRPWKGHLEGTKKPVTGPSQADVKKGIANLNNIKHCRKKPLRTEFLEPLEDFKNVILRTSKRCYIFLIHGMDDTIRDYKGINVVVGYGAGDPPRHSCSLTFRDRFISCLSSENFAAAGGKAGGRLSAWDSKNLNQLYIKEDNVTSVQVEIALTLRATDKQAIETSKKVAAAINRACGSGSVQFLKNIPER